MYSSNAKLNNVMDSLLPWHCSSPHFDWSFLLYLLFDLLLTDYNILYCCSIRDLGNLSEIQKFLYHPILTFYEKVAYMLAFVLPRWPIFYHSPITKVLRICGNNNLEILYNNSRRLILDLKSHRAMRCWSATLPDFLRKYQSQASIKKTSPFGWFEKFSRYPKTSFASWLNCFCDDTLLLF